MLEPHVWGHQNHSSLILKKFIYFIHLIHLFIYFSVSIWQMTDDPSAAVLHHSISQYSMMAVYIFWWSFLLRVPTMILQFTRSLEKRCHYQKVGRVKLWWNYVRTCQYFIPGYSNSYKIKSLHLNGHMMFLCPWIVSPTSLHTETGESLCWRHFRLMMAALRFQLLWWCILIPNPLASYDYSTVYFGTNILLTRDVLWP